MTRVRMDSGLVIILPGIEGESPLNHDIRRGLVEGKLFHAMPIYRWGRPVPIAGPLLNQMDILGNRLEGKKIAEQIVSYQRSYPGRPVYLLGHSAGGGIAVFAAEALPKGAEIDGLVLLSASISSAYDLTEALGHCRKGILNIFTPADIGFLVVGTTLAGNVDGLRGPAAGAIGFDRPSSHASANKTRAYHKLYQLELTGTELGGAHTGTTHSSFITTYVSPWLAAPWWPPPKLPGVTSMGMRPAKDQGPPGQGREVVSKPAWGVAGFLPRHPEAFVSQTMARRSRSSAAPNHPVLKPTPGQKPLPPWTDEAYDGFYPNPLALFRHRLADLAQR